MSYANTCNDNVTLFFHFLMFLGLFNFPVNIFSVMSGCNHHIQGIYSGVFVKETIGLHPGFLESDTLSLDHHAPLMHQSFVTTVPPTYTHTLTYGEGWGIARLKCGQSTIFQSCWDGANASWVLTSAVGR